MNRTKDLSIDIWQSDNDAQSDDDAQSDEGSQRNPNVSLDLKECVLCHTVWFNAENVATSQRNYKPAKAAVERVRAQLIAAAANVANVNPVTATTAESAATTESALGLLSSDSGQPPTTDAAAAAFQPGSTAFSSSAAYEVDDSQGTLTDLLLLLGIVLSAVLTLFLKLLQQNMLAGIAFLLVTVIAAFMSWRFLVDSTHRMILSASIAIAGLIVACLIVWW